MSTVVSAPRDDCGHGQPRLPVEEARRRILADVTPVRGSERLALRSALGRVLAQDLISPVDVPGHTNSAVDGYALAGSGLPVQGEKDFRVIGTAWAGRSFPGAVPAGSCVRIMTGAPMPAGTDAVVMQEHVELRDDAIRVGAGHRTGQNVRAAGEDLARGAVALHAGKRLTPADLGLLASIGLGEVAVHRRVRVAFFSTGDELRSIGEPLEDGAIYDSNRYTLYGMLAALGVEILDMGVVRDKREAVRDAFREAAAIADAIITSGGVSVGEADYVKETLEALGRVSFWQIAMKPGRPLAFGHVGNKIAGHRGHGVDGNGDQSVPSERSGTGDPAPVFESASPRNTGAAFFGLPGNPVAVMVTFYQFVQPALQRMMGEDPVGAPPTFEARSLTRFRKQPGRTEFQRAIAEHDANGELVVRATGGQGSGILHSMSQANCFVVLPENGGNVEPGMRVAVQPFFGLMP
jgi:molybdopterin molybdotransferase